MCKVIFISNDPKEQQLTQQLFDRYNLFKDAVCFLNWPSAIALLKSNSSKPENLPDLVLCDLNIQQESSWKFLEAFEQLYFSLSKTIDFCMIADWTDPADRFRAQLYPFVKDLWQKPLNKDDFILLYLSYQKKDDTTDKLHTFIQSTIHKTFGTPPMSSKNLSEQLLILQQEKAALAKALSLANTELLFQLEEKSQRAAELIVANIELDFQNKEKGARAAELILANIELDFQNDEKRKRAAELAIANIELDFQNLEKEKRAAELKLANIELDFQNLEKDKRATELLIANKELLFQNLEKEKRAAELIIANTELVFQNQEKEKRADELVIANTELLFQNEEKEKRANELVLANKELIYQNKEKGKRAAELVIANIELDFQEVEKEKRAEAEAKKDEFFNMVSHELKTPLTNIKAINQVMEKALDKSEKNYPFINSAGNSIKRLERLIEDLLDVTKINAGDIDLNITSFDLSEALTQSIATVQQISPKHVILLENNIGIIYSGDQFRIERVLINLLNNAIKFSPDADLVIVKATADLVEVTVSVQDFGIGIAKEDIDQLFNRFFRVSKTAMKFQGVGLGLYIAAEIIKRHRGHFTISSKLGKGSFFAFHLPLQTDDTD
ncbi:ATP-binding protein [Mucilaginibacter sp. UYCu711]|uniref:ATP-binding response regulator n=1 Tax=Mucilaginibacter sp. UYCu711 TaxID=3156339 RepID=UPI003D1BD29B